MIKKRVNDSIDVHRDAYVITSYPHLIVGMSNQRQWKTFESGEGAKQLNS